MRTLQARLVLISVLLLTVVGAVVGAGAAFSLAGYLTDQLDAQARDVASFRADPPPGPDGTPLDPPPPPNAGGGFVGGGPQRPGETLEVRVRDGRVLTATRSDRFGVEQPLAPDEAAPALAVAEGEPPRTVTVDGREYRTVAVPVVAEPGTRVVVGLDTGAVEATVTRLVLTGGVVLAVGVVVAGLVAAWATRRALRPLRQVAGTARRVSELPLERGEVELAERVPAPLTDDRSEVGQVGVALNRLLGHVEGALAARQDSETRLRRFVADASHELRTPLAAIRGYTELAARRGDDLPPEVAAMLDRVGAQSRRMTSLVEDLLLLARLDAGRPLAREPVDLARLLADAVSDAHAAAPGHRWSLDLPDPDSDRGAAPEVVGDPEGLHRVVANLLANARVHTPDGTLVVARLRATDGGDRRGVVVDVVDEGPGIAEALLPHVTSRFTRGDAARSGTGTGLGLSIVAAVVDEHGGELEVTSGPGGTRVRIRLFGAVGDGPSDGVASQDGALPSAR